MELGSYIKTIGAPNHHLAMRDLKPLSDLEQGSRAEFQEAWRQIRPERRVDIARAMVDLAEENVDLQFQMALLWCLEDPEAAVRAIAAEGLWESESVTVLRRLTETLRGDPAPEVRAASATALGRFAYMAEIGELNDDEARGLFETLLALASDERQPVDVRRRALESAGYFSSEDEVQAQIERAYATDDLSLQESALVAMGRSMLPRWLPTIADALESRSPALRYEAARAAGEMADGARSLVGRLLKLLADTDTEVAIAAIWALGQIGGESARRALRQAANVQDEARSQAAADALAELSLDQGIVGNFRGPRSGRQN